MGSIPSPLYQWQRLYEVCMDCGNNWMIFVTINYLALCDLEDTIAEEILVPDRMVGLIIGRGGSVLSRLQMESGTKIQMAAYSLGMPDR